MHFIDKFVAEASGVIEMSMADTDLVMHSQLQECAVGFYSRNNFMEVLALGRTVHTVEIFNGWGNWNALQLPLLEMIACRQLVYSSDTEDRNLGTLPHCHWYGHDDISFQDLPVFTKFGAGNKAFKDMGIDVRTPNQLRDNVLPLKKILGPSKAYAAAPKWMIDAGMVPQPKKPLPKRANDSSGLTGEPEKVTPSTRRKRR